MRTYVGVQTNRLHGSGIIGIRPVAQGLSTATKTPERSVVVGIVHHWSLVVHCYRGGVVRIVSGGEGVREKREEGGDADDMTTKSPF